MPCRARGGASSEFLHQKAYAWEALPPRALDNEWKRHKYSDILDPSNESNAGCEKCKEVCPWTFVFDNVLPCMSLIGDEAFCFTAGLAHEGRHFGVNLAEPRPMDESGTENVALLEQPNRVRTV